MSLGPGRSTQLLLAGVLIAIGVSHLSAQTSGPVAAEEASAPFRFADAMSARTPLQKVPGGGAEPLCEAAPSTVERYADALAYGEEMGSYSLLVWRRGRCELAHYYPPFDDSLRAEPASMHKSVVALLLAAAIADGAVGSADDPIGRYLPAWRNDPRGDIPLRHVLTMSSGLEPFSREGGLSSPAWTYVDGPGDARAETLGRPLVREPGTLFHYSGFNSQLLLMVIEAATGRPYADYLSERLWQPLGNSDAWLWLYDESRPMPRAFISLMARAEDWLRVGLLIKDLGRYGGRQLIPAELIGDMTSPSAAYANYGWQLWLGTEYEPVRYYNSSGEGAGFSSAEPFAVDDMIYFDGIGGQRVYMSRSLDLVIVRQGDMRPDWDDTRLPNLIIRAAGEGGGS